MAYLDNTGLAHFWTKIKAAFMPKAFQIIQQPTDTYGGTGAYSSFHVGTNDPGASYRWEWYVNGGWCGCPHEGNDSPTLYVLCGATEETAAYRCHVTFSDGTTETSDEAEISAEGEFAIVKQPESMVVSALGDTFHFTVEVNDPDATYKWQTSQDGGSTWGNSSLAGNTTKRLGNIASNASRVSYLYRCNIRFTGAESLVHSEPVSVTVNANAAAAASESSLQAAAGELF